LIYGECGGYMTLGEGLIDAEGICYPMAGLLPITTSFSQRKLQLGYRRLKPMSAAPWYTPLRGHEFHYSTVVHHGLGDPLFEAWTAKEDYLGLVGMRIGNALGSYMHLISEEAIQ
jgi:cobyrinic acid a,c-diamide synthase